MSPWWFDILLICDQRYRVLVARMWLSFHLVRRIFSSLNSQLLFEEFWMGCDLADLLEPTLQLVDPATSDTSNGTLLPSNYRATPRIVIRLTRIQSLHLHSIKPPKLHRVALDAVPTWGKYFSTARSADPLQKKKREMKKWRKELNGNRHSWRHWAQTEHCFLTTIRTGVREIYPVTASVPSRHVGNILIFAISSCLLSFFLYLCLDDKLTDTDPCGRDVRLPPDRVCTALYFVESDPGSLVTAGILLSPPTAITFPLVAKVEDDRHWLQFCSNLQYHLSHVNWWYLSDTMSHKPRITRFWRWKLNERWVWWESSLLTFYCSYREAVICSTVILPSEPVMESTFCHSPNIQNTLLWPSKVESDVTGKICSQLQDFGQCVSDIEWMFQGDS